MGGRGEKKSRNIVNEGTRRVVARGKVGYASIERKSLLEINNAKPQMGAPPLFLEFI